jgi:hypothetical protein
MSINGVNIDHLPYPLLVRVAQGLGRYGKWRQKCYGQPLPMAIRKFRRLRYWSGRRLRGISTDVEWWRPVGSDASAFRAKTSIDGYRRWPLRACGRENVQVPVRTGPMADNG